MIGRLRNLLAGLVALAAILALLAGIPAALATQVGWPLPTSWPELDEVTRALQLGVTDTVLINALAIIVWVAWAQLAAALLAETFALARHRAARTLPVLPGLQPLAARLLAAAMLLMATSGPRAATATPLEQLLTTPATAPVAAAQTTDAAAASLDPPSTTQPAQPATTTITTGERDSWWRLAERHLGDGLRWREIRELNLGHSTGDGHTITTDTDRLEPGWQLQVPSNGQPSSAGEVEQTDPASSIEPDGQPPAGEADDQPTNGPDETWEVEPGEHFWAIAEQTLTGTWDRTPTDEETASYWRELVETNLDRLEPPNDPDLIYPGQQFVLPPPPTDPTVDTDSDTQIDTSSEDQPDLELGRDGDAERDRDHLRGEPGLSPEPHDRAEPDDLHAPAIQPPNSDAAQRPPTVPSTSGPESPASANGATGAGDAHDEPSMTPRPGWSDAVTGGQAGEPATDAATGDLEEGERLTGWGVPAGLTTGVAATGLLAAGVLALLRRRRNAALQQRPAGLRVPTPAPDGLAQEARLQAAAPPERTLDELADLLASIPEGVHPVLVTTTDDATVTVLFDDETALPTPPEPWTLAEDGRDGPVGWRAQLGATGPFRSIGLPLLVTCGRTETCTVLANVAAMGHLEVSGEPAAVRGRLRAMALEVASSRIAGPVEVAVAGDDQLVCVEDLRHTEDLAGEIAAARAEQDADIAIDDRLPRLLVCHPDSPVPELPEDTHGLIGLLAAHPSAGEQGWRLSLDADRGRLRLPDGAEIELTLPQLDPDLIVEELNRLDEPHPAPAEPSVAEVDTASNGQATVTRECADKQPWCEVRLLGPVQVLRDGVELDKLTPLTLEVLTYLVTHRDGASKERLEDAVWAGQAAGPNSQRLRAILTKLRRALGDGPDGRPLLPPRPSGASHIELSTHVGNDLDRALAHLAVARQLPESEQPDEQLAALDLVRGEPFEDLPVSWATNIQQRAIAQLQDAAATAASAYRHHGDYERALYAIEQGLKLCDPAETLYIEWAHLEAARGRRDQLPRLWQRLRRQYAADADETAGVMATPTAETELAFQALMSKA